MKKICLLMFAIALLAGCSENGVDKNGWEKTWYPAHKIFVSETTYEKSPTQDNYWAFVLNFYDPTHVVKYQTPNRDLTYHKNYMNLVDTMTYSYSYPTIYCKYADVSLGVVEINVTNSQTLDLYGYTTYILRNNH